MMTSKKFVAVLAVAIFLLTACGAPSNSTEPATVAITLTEFGIESSRESFEVGVPYQFVVTNKGAISHEVMLMAPTMANQMDMDMEEMDEMALATIVEDDLPPGATKTFDYTFTEPAATGDLELACHVSGHYEAGMKLPITVK
ncbi:MAG: hypothetical protein HUU23_10520 [Caldilineales bacterium]|nr:hypothetical protein [Caldilineales bacterium]